MSNLERQNLNKIFLGIVEGSLRQTVKQGVEGAVMRNWEAGGKSGTKWELAYPAVSGHVKNISFYDGEHDGKKYTNLQIEFDENENGNSPIVSVGARTRYAEDIMMKLPNINFEEEVRLRPFSFVPEGEDRAVTGVEVLQRSGTGNFDKKIDKKFTKDKPNGMPEPSDDERNDWTLYFRRRNNWLRQYTTEKICSKFIDDIPRIKSDAPEIDPRDSPF